MRVQMTFFGQSDGRQTVLPRLGWMPIELPILESTRSSANSSRIKSYDCLKLILIFQSRNDFMGFIQDQKRIRDQIFKKAQIGAQYHLKGVHLNQGRSTRPLKSGAHKSRRTH